MISDRMACRNRDRGFRFLIGQGGTGREPADDSDHGQLHGNQCVRGDERVVGPIRSQQASAMPSTNSSMLQTKPVLLELRRVA